MAETQLSFGLPKPGKALIGLMVALVALWVMFAVGINWGGAGTEVFGWLVGTDDILHGQLWRLVTAPLLHQPSGPGAVSHILFNVIGLYFLGTTLEERWGGKRFLLFCLGAGVFASLLQAIGSHFIPQVHQDAFYGAWGITDAIAVAWALSFKNSQVRLFFVLPVSGMGLLLFILLMNVMYVIAAETRHEGLVTPFGGMLAGYLFGDTSPLRRWWLTRRFKKLQSESAALRSVRLATGGPKLKVLEGGLGGSGGSGGKKPPADKSYLN